MTHEYPAPDDEPDEPLALVRRSAAVTPDGEYTQPEEVGVARLPFHVPPPLYAPYETHDAFVQRVIAWTRAEITQHGEDGLADTPLVTACGQRGAVSVFADGGLAPHPSEGLPQGARMRAIGRDLARRKRVRKRTGALRHVVTVQEVWYVPSHIEPTPACRPTDHPDRCEGLLVADFDAGTRRGTGRLFTIERDSAGHITGTKDAEDVEDVEDAEDFAGAVLSSPLVQAFVEAWNAQYFQYR